MKQFSNEVYAADTPIVKVGRAEIDFLKTKLAGVPRGRIRLCAHADNNDALHEMFIALSKKTYVRPHKHPGKSESFHAVEGAVDVVIFDDHGGIQEVVQLGDPGSGRQFYYRLSAPLFHTLIIRSEILVIHETTNGPFRRDGTIFAPWAPEENGPDVDGYMRRLARAIEPFLAKY